MKEKIFVKIGIAAGLILMFGQIIPFAFAQQNGAVAYPQTAGKTALLSLKKLPETVPGSPTSDSSSAPAGQTLTTIIARSDSLIANRITSLNSELTRVQNDTKMNITEKSTLTNQISTMITGLTTLKTKIDADTTAEAAFADAKQIFSNYRVYAVAEPKTRITVVINNLETLTAQLQSVIPQFQKLLTNLQSQGKDTSEIAPLITDINTQLATATTSLSTDSATVQSVSTNAQNPDATFAQVKNDIRTVISASFQKIRTDLAQMKKIFTQLGLSEVQPTPTIGSPTSNGQTATPSAGGFPVVTPTILPTTTSSQ